MNIRGNEVELYDHEAVCSVIRESGDFYEAAILDDINDRHGPEATVLDVGAHIGNHSVYWLAAGCTRLYAFEPVPASHAILQRNLAPWPHAYPVRAAVSDAPGTLGIVVDKTNMGRSHIASFARPWALSAQAIPLDGLDLEDVSLVKIDVEGWQDHVLSGAKWLLWRWHPALLVEDEEGLVEPTLHRMGIHGYEHRAEWPGANHLWEWAA